MSINIYDPILKKLTPVAGNNEATVASLDALSNVNISSPTEGQIIKFDEINNIWVNVNDDNAPMELGELSNVNLLSVSNGQIIKYDATAEEWINADPQIIESIEDIPNVELTNLADGEFLVYDSLSEKWINTSLSGGYGIKISDGVISSKCFVGTTAEWEALSPIEQNEYTFVNLTDDYDEAREIDIAYVKELPLEGSIQDKFYGLLSYVKENKVVADGFLDDYQNFIKTTTEDGYIYTSDVVDVSVNDVDYVELTSLEYDSTKFILNGETDIAIGDTFYWKEVSDAIFYGGDSATQTFHTIEKTLVVDSVPTEESNNPVASDGVYTALQTKADTSSLSLVATSGESEDVSYSHSTSGLAADNVQDAIDELADEKIDATDVSSVGKASYVQIDSINNQDVLQYDLSANKWKNSTALKDLAKSTNVLGAKNLLPNKATTQVSHGVTFTINDDGSVKANGTNDGTQVSVIFPFGVIRNLVADYFPSMDKTYVEYMSANNTLLELLIIWEDENKTTISQSRTTTKAEFTIPSNAVYFRCDIRVAQNATISNEIAYPMICLKSVYDLDDTYEPYAKTNQQLTEDTTALLDNTEVNGAVNIAPNNLTSQVISGINITANSDGSFTADGTASAAIFLTLATFTVPKTGNYKLTGAPSGSSWNNHALYVEQDSTVIGYDVGEGKILTLTQGVNYRLRLKIANYDAISNLTFKPMLTVPSYNGDYVPYAKSNRELTEDVANARVLIGSVTQHVTVTADGTKTIQTLMQELHSALSSLVASLNTDEVIYILGARSDGGTWFRPFNVELKYSKGSTVGNISMDSFTVTAGENCYHYSLTFSSTLTTNTFRQMTVAQSGNTFIDRTSDVPSANSQLLLTYQIYKTIS